MAENHPEYLQEMFGQVTFDATGAYAKQLPALVWQQSGEPVAEDVIKALLKTLKVTGPVVEAGRRSSKHRVVFSGQRDRLRQSLRQLFEDVEPQSAREFSAALWELWKENKYSEELHWCAWGAGFFGGDTMTLRLYEQLQEWLKKGKWGYKLAVQTLDVLKSIDTPMARMTLAQFAQSGRSGQLNEQAMVYIKGLAAQEKLSIQEFEERNIPTCGLDGRGERRFDYGPRQFRVGVGENFYPVVKDEKGKTYKSLPKPKGEDDAALVSEAQREWEMLRGSLIHVFKVQIRRLEQQMIGQRRWQAERWQQHILHHPVMILFARNLLWGALDAQGKRTLFRVAEDGTLADVEDELFTLEEQREVLLAHPLTLSTHELQRWGDVFTDYEVIAPFAQLGRPVFRAGDETHSHEIYQDVTLSPRALRTFMKYDDFDAAFVVPYSGALRTSYSKHYPPHPHDMRLELSPGLQVGTYEGDQPQRIVAVSFCTHGYAEDGLEAEQVDPMVFSEGWATLHALVSAAREA